MKRMLLKAGRAAAHVLFLAALFVVSVLFFSRMINQTTPDEALAMESSTFPLVYMQRKGVNFNCLHGYVREMDASALRESITPLQSDRSIDIQIQTYSSTIDSVSYEVLSLDGKEQLENTKVIKLETDNDIVRAKLTLQNRMLMNKEYILKIRLVTGGRSIWYYTNVVLADGLHADEYLNFVIGFYDKTVNKSDLGTVAAAVEPDETTDAEATLAYMDIHDSVDQLTWASLNPQIYYKPTPQICEINTNTASLRTEYRIASVNEDGRTEIFNVKEYYHVRFTDSRVFLLNFERTTDEVFDPENSVLDKRGIILGITDKDIEFKSDPKRRIVAFVQENELWTYENATSRLTQVFSFPQKENMDYRDFYDASSIQVLRVSTGGDVWFTVSGYMNRGDHEGDNGIALYYYEASTDMVEEKLFLESSESWGLLEKDAEMLSYVTEDEQWFFALIEERVYRVRLSDRTVDVIAENVHNNCCASSADNRYFAYLAEGEEYASAALRVLDLENTDKPLEYKAGEGEYIRPLCYMDQDLVYGLARQDDIAIATLDSGLFPMYSLHIVDGEGNELKNYEPSDTWVTDITVSDAQIALTRKTKNEEGNAFIDTSADQIVGTGTEDLAAMGTATMQTTRKQTEVILRVGSSISDTTPDIVRSKIVSYESSRKVTVQSNPQPEKLCCVYGSGKLYRRYSQAREAIAAADRLLGFVTDDLGNYMWIRGNRDVTAQINVDRIPRELRTGITDAAQLSQETGMDFYDLTGCQLDQVMYFISRGYPVAAVGEKGPVLIVGYDEFNTHLLDPGSDEWYYYGLEDSKAMFEAKGNIFTAYLG